MAHHTEETRCNMGIGRREIKQEWGKNLHHVSTCSAAWENLTKLGGNNGHITTSCGVEKTQWENSVCCHVPRQIMQRAQPNVATCLAKCCNVPRQMLPRAQTNHATSRAKSCNVPRQVLPRAQPNVATCLSQAPCLNLLGRLGELEKTWWEQWAHYNTLARGENLVGKKRYFGQKNGKNQVAWRNWKKTWWKHWA